MSDWVKRITSLLNMKSAGRPIDLAIAEPPSIKIPKKDTLPDEKIKLENNSDKDSVLSKHYNRMERKANPNESVSNNSFEEGNMADIDGKGVEKHKEDDDNVKALEKLRSLPKVMGSQVDSRIAAIKNLLGEKEIFRTLQKLRWPKGVVCPRCRSSNIVRRDPPQDAPDKRHYYECLNCKGEGDPSDFDDFTGLPVGSLQGLRQWILCWYLIGFCSISQIARVMGLSVYEVTQIASYGSQITEIPVDADIKDVLKAKEKQRSDKKKADKDKSAKGVEHQEENTRREGLQPFKPGYKSKK